MLAKIKTISSIVLMLTLSVGAAVGVHEARSSNRKLQELTSQADTTLKRVDSFTKFQLDEFQSERYQKSVKAGVDTGAYANSVMRSINVRVIPEIVALLKTAQTNSTDISNLTVALESLVLHTDTSLNAAPIPFLTRGGLLASLTVLVQSFNTLAQKTGLTVDEVNASVKMASEKLGMSLDAMYALMSDPAWLATLKNVEGTTAEVRATAANVAEASKQMPSIAASLEKIAKTSSRFTKITLTANVLAVLASAFLPFLR